MRKVLHGRVEGVDAGQCLAGVRRGPQCLEHDRRIGETGALRQPVPARRRGASVCLKGAPHGPIVLETDIRLAEQPFENSHQIGPGQSVFAPGERPHGFHRHRIRDQNGLPGIENGVRARRLGLVIVQQIAEQDVGIE